MQLTIFNDLVKLFLKKLCAVFMLDNNSKSRACDKLS